MRKKNQIEEALSQQKEEIKKKIEQICDDKVALIDHLKIADCVAVRQIKRDLLKAIEDL